MSIRISGSSGLSGVVGTAGTPALAGASDKLGINFQNDQVNIGINTTNGVKFDNDGNIQAVGVVTATSFSGDGSNLTGIDATSLKDSGATVRVQANTSGIVVTGITTATGNILPSDDATYNLGGTSNRWANIYSADLQLSNEGFTNDVDGTWGKYTIQEGENDLFLINRRTGRKYKFMLEEVE